MSRYDILIRGGRIVDPANNRDEIADLGIRDGSIVDIGSLEGAAHEEIEASGKLILPGLIDTHVHLTSSGGGQVAHAALARAGVTTALDLAGPIEDVLANAATNGTGLTIAALEFLGPGRRIGGADPSRTEVRDAIEAAMSAGALGIKLHFDTPVTPSAAAYAIEETNDRGAYMAVHCGTTETASDITGLRETVAMVGDYRLHIAHVNSYCRGASGDATAEAIEAVALLQSVPQCFSEAYLSAFNGNSGECVDGKPRVARVIGWLASGGYPGTQDGLRQAIADGYAIVPASIDGELRALSSMEAVAHWEEQGTKTGIGFPVNPPASRVHLATAKDECGRFAVDAIATDGGKIPRNNQLYAGLGLVQLDMMLLSEFVTKSAWTPARVLGLPNKGQIGAGADADFIVVDPVARTAEVTIAAGHVIANRGRVCGSGTTVLTTDAGSAAVRASGNAVCAIDLARSGFYTGDGLKT